MSRVRVAVLVLLGMGVLLAVVPQEAGGASVHTGNATLHVVVADTPEERREGLMNRSAVPRDGMLFVFPDAAPRTFWMKHTRIPLDIVFIAGNGTVLNVAYAGPGAGVPEDRLRRYRSDGAARYVLEVARGDAARYGIVAGTELTIDR